MAFQLPDLTYDYSALEPYIDAQTMEIHHTKHHQAYTNNLNAALEGTDLGSRSIEDILTNLADVPKAKLQAVINNGGGFYNHSIFWQILGTNASDPTGAVNTAILEKWNTLDAFKQEFEAAAKTRFGSGWAWLVVQDKELKVVSTANQDSPISSGQVPILALDVWEHAYYLKYQNRRPEYVSAFWNVVNWEAVNSLYETAQTMEPIAAQSCACGKKVVCA